MVSYTYTPYTSFEVHQNSNQKLSRRVHEVRAMRIGLVIVGTIDGKMSEILIFNKSIL